MRSLDLFAGAGGSIWAGMLLGWHPVCAVEIDPYCRRVLQARQDDGCFDRFPIHDDVRSFDGSQWRGRVDVLTAGFPCQPFSVAGKQRGADDARNLWPDTSRIIRETRPRWCLLENVPGLITSGYFGTITSDLAQAGYDAAWCCLSAAQMGAPHKRNRLWVACRLSHSDSGRQQEHSEGHHLHGDLSPWSITSEGLERQSARSVAYSNSERFEERNSSPIPGQTPRARTASGSEDRSWWSADPAERKALPSPQSLVGRVADGVANRKHRLRGLGNGWVPEVAACAWHHLRYQIEHA